MRAVVFTTASVGYWFVRDSDGTFGYRKTTNGGASWGAEVVVSADTTNQCADVWFDQWTPGDSGTLIHMWYVDVTNDDVFWRSLDTASDTLGTQRVVFAASTAVAGRGMFVSGTKARDGTLYCAYDVDAGAERGIHRSTDSGTTWSANLSTTFVEATLDEAMLFPASNTGDNRDIWCIYHDTSANALTLKMWDSSAAAQVESSTIQTFLENVTDLIGQYGFSGSIRHSDGHLIMASVSEYDAGTSDHQTWDINGTGSITAKTAITTNIDDHYYPAVFIDQTTDDIYVAFNGLRDGSEVIATTTKVYYTLSTDGGTSWSAGSTAYMEGAAGVVVQVWAPLSGPRFYVGWRVGSTLVGNAVNSVTFGAGTTVDPGLGVLDLTGFAPTVTATAHKTVTPGLGAITLTGFAPTKIIGTVRSTGLGAIDLTGFAPTVQLPKLVTPGVGVLDLTGFAPIVAGGAGVTKTPGTGVLDITGLAPTVLTPVTVTPGLGVLTITGLAPDVAGGAGTTKTPGTGALDLTGFAPLVILPRTVTPGVGDVTLAGFAPTVTTSAHLTVTTGVGTLTLDGFAPAVSVTISFAMGTKIVDRSAPRYAVVDSSSTRFFIGEGSGVAAPATATATWDSEEARWDDYADVTFDGWENPL